jgi:hypothetical protein
MLELFLQMSTHTHNTITDLFQNNLPKLIFKVIEANMTDVNTLTICLNIINNMYLVDENIITPERLIIIRQALAFVNYNVPALNYSDVEIDESPVSLDTETDLLPILISLESDPEIPAVIDINVDLLHT